MESTMTVSTMAALFGTMVVLAATPSISVFTVLARSVTSGLIHGVFTTIGIVVGDIFFILLAVLGLSVLVETMGSMFVLVKYLGGAYLIWWGVKLSISKAKVLKAKSTIESSWLSSFLAGLFITLGDQKAILFYFSFFPAFLDLSTVSYFDMSMIILMAIVAIGGVKLGYAYMANRANLFIHSKVYRGMNIAIGSVILIVGVFIILKA